MNGLPSELMEEDNFEYDDDIFCDVIPQPMTSHHGNTSVGSLQDEVGYFFHNEIDL